jgi:CubicO group peptidase (beta-lactamase class C family)
MHCADARTWSCFDWPHDCWSDDPLLRVIWTTSPLPRTLPPIAVRKQTPSSTRGRTSRGAVFLMVGLATLSCGRARDDHRMADREGVTSTLTALTASSTVPGLEYVVVGADGILFDYAGGWTDIRRRVTVETDTTMMVYSMSKTITAVAVLQLVQAGHVGLDDSVARYVDGLPYGPRVTVRQLLSHTGGIPNPIPLRWVHPAADPDRFDEDAALAAVLHDRPRLSFEPGTRYAYSNIGYWLVGKVVERASGVSFTACVHEHILRRLAIPPAELGYVVSNPARHATGYLEEYSWMSQPGAIYRDDDIRRDSREASGLDSACRCASDQLNNPARTSTCFDRTSISPHERMRGFK